MYVLDFDQVKTQKRQIGQMIRAKIKSFGYSKRAIARASGVSLNTVNNCLAGENITLESLLSIAWVMGMNISDIAMDTRKLAGSNFPTTRPMFDTGSAAVAYTKIKECAAATGIPEEQLCMRAGIDPQELPKVE